jgi:hypothetical protein
MRPVPVRPASLLLTLVALAAGPRARADDVRVTVLAITATSQNQDVNPKLKEIAREVQKHEPSLTGFKLGQTTVKTLNVGQQKVSFDLVDGEKVDITVLAKDDSRQRVTLAFKPPLVGEITYSISYGKYFPLVTRYLTKNDKERLIVAIMVKPVTREGR